MVFADQGEILSGGNFHGEYPAKVSIKPGSSPDRELGISSFGENRVVNPEPC